MIPEVADQLKKINMNRNNIKYILKEYVETKKIVLTEHQLNETLLNEGWKDVLLGIALLTGVGLSSAQAQTAKKVLSNDEVKSKIENVLSDTSMLNKITKNLPSDIKAKIESNAKEALTKLDDTKHKGRVGVTVKTNEKGLASKLKQGYAISDISSKTDTIHGKPQVILYDDTLDIGFHSDNLFVTAGYELSQDGINAIESIKDSITAVGGTITGVNIESSTDKEPIKMGNDKLSQLRAESVAEMFDGVDAVINTLPDQGPDLYHPEDHHTLSKSERIHDREVTAKYRYVKVSITATFQDTIIKDTPGNVIEKNTITLIKAITDIGHVKKIHGTTKRKTGHAKLKKRKITTCKSDGCPKFNNKKLFSWLKRGSQQ